MRLKSLAGKSKAIDCSTSTSPCLHIIFFPTQSIRVESNTASGVYLQLYCCAYLSLDFRLIPRVLLHIVIGEYLTLGNGEQPVVVIGGQDGLTLFEPVFFTSRDGQPIAL